MTDSADSKDYKTQYAILKSVAEQLRNQQEPDIDKLLPLVDQGLAAYKFCKSRIEVVRLAFAEKLPDETPGPSSN